MANYSEMDFLFESKSNLDTISQQLNRTSKDNTVNIFKDNPGYVLYKSKFKSNTNTIKTHYQQKIYNNDTENVKNPYIKLLKDFNAKSGTPGAGLRLKASDLAYLRDLGVYPLNRMAILRRFPEGCFVTEDLNEMKIEPISTIVGWIKPDQGFGTINFNETWVKTTERFDTVLAGIIKKLIGGGEGGLATVPDFAQGMLFEWYKNMGLLERSGVDDSVDEDYEFYNQNRDVNWKWNNTNSTSEDKKTPEVTKEQQEKIDTLSKIAGTNANSDSWNKDKTWGLNRIPIGDPNVLQEAPFRDPVGQNIISDFQFELSTVYEQKMLGEVDPGTAMLDILDNMYAMGTSNMTFYWGDASPAISAARRAASNDGNNLQAWWDLVYRILDGFWTAIVKLFNGLKNEADKVLEDATATQEKAETPEVKKEIAELDRKIAKYEEADVYYKKFSKTTGDNNYTELKKEAEAKKSELQGNPPQKTAVEAATEAAKGKSEILDTVLLFIKSALTSTVAIHRFKLRGTIELMTGGKISSSPWYLTLGNPYSPWLATNHIIVQSAIIDTSPEMGFNDQPQWLSVKFTCKLSRSLGKQELMRMFNNTYRRTYNQLPVDWELIAEQQDQGNYTA